MGRTLKVWYMAVDPAMPADKRPKAGLMQGNQIPIDADEDYFDGPVCGRVAVIDLDPDTGALVKGAKFLPDGKRRKMATHQVADKSDMTALDFQQVSVYGAIRTTMEIFEREDVLNRKVTWAFDGPQLLVVPRAGRMANAFYQRESRSLQFFYFDGLVGDEETTVYTCLSPDIVAHECAHAILDGIAPDLYDATAPQSLGLHEAVSDLTAFLFAAQSGYLRNLVLERNGGHLRQPGAFNAIAEQFGRARSGRIQPLRDLMNRKRLSDVKSASPHALSEVLTGALYEMFLRSYDAEMAEKLEEVGDTPENRYRESGFILFRVAARFARIVLRALDYLPPGEVSFADYIRTIIAADAAANPDSPQERDFLVEEAVWRGILRSPADAGDAAPDLDVSDIDLDALLTDDAAALAFADAHRASLFIPDGARIEMRPRMDVSRRVYPKDGGSKMVAEIILKVSWVQTALIPGIGGLFQPVEIRSGTTVAIGREARDLRLLVTNSPLAHGRADRLVHDDMRRAWLGAQLANGALDLAEHADALPDGTYRFRGLAQQLHIAGR